MLWAFVRSVRPTARALAGHFLTLDELLLASIETLEEVDDVGPIVAKHIRAFVSEPRNQQVIASLVAAGVNWPAMSTAGGEAAGGYNLGSDRQA